MVALVPAQVLDRFSDHRWRLSNLYWITDKEGKRVKFEPNWAQMNLLDELHYLNLVLKARQLGFTTFIQIYMLDMAVFYPDTRAGVIAQTMDDASAIFRDKIKFPYDNLPDGIKSAVPTKRDNTTMLELANNSIIRVGTSLRSGTLQFLHVSEFGKICAKFPERAREIVTGALNTIQAGQVAFIESTAEGQEGRFHDMCQEAQSEKRQGTELTPLDWKFHFYPWWKESAYEIDPTNVTIAPSLQKYFQALEGIIGIKLNDRKRAWYAKKHKDQKGDMKREFPSTPEEAFEASVEGAYYSEQLAKAEEDGRIGLFKADLRYKVHMSWDIGRRDHTAIWFWQIIGTRIRFVGFYQASGEVMSHFVIKAKSMANEHGWTIGTLWLPHDAKVIEWTSEGTQRIEKLLKHFKAKLVPDHYVEDGINAFREIFDDCEFDKELCADGLKCLHNYRKQWDEDTGRWRDKPLHNWASDGADSGRYTAIAYKTEKDEPQTVIKPPVGITGMTFDQLMERQVTRAERA